MNIEKRSLRLVVCLVITVISVAFIAAEKPTKETSNGKLIFAQVIFRHGDRTPIEPYPNDPWKDSSYWPTGFGQLTNPGKRRHLALGRWLRTRYNELLNSTYSTAELYIRSTDVDRTLMSAEANLAGMFPPTGADEWDPSIKWQPIPIHTIPETMDEILAAKKPCPAYELELKRYRHTDAFQALNASLAPLYAYLTEHSGKKVDSPTSVSNMYSCLHIEHLNNFTLPEWTRSVYPEPMATIAGKTFALKTNTTLLARLKVGPLMKEILNRFSLKAAGQLRPNRSLWVYSGHDTTIAAVLNALGLFDYHSPPFTACVMFELRVPSSGTEAYVSIFYKNFTSLDGHDTQALDALNIPGCGPRCPLSRLFTLYEDILPVDWDRECKLSLLSLTYVEMEDMDTSDGIAGVTLLATFVLLGLILCAVIFYQRRRYGYHNERWYVRIDG